MPIITTSHCQAKVANRDTITESESGLLLRRSPTGRHSWAYRTRDASTCKKFGTYPQMTVREARREANRLRDREQDGENVIQSARKAEALEAERLRRGGVTVDRLIGEWIEYIKSPVHKKHVGLAPRVKTWANVESQLLRFVSPRLGRKLAADVTNIDIARLEQDIKQGHFGKPSVSNARHARKALSSMYSWAALPPHAYVNANPCAALPKLDDEPGRDRPMTDAEIKRFWQLLDDGDNALCRSVRLLFKFALATARRTNEVRLLQVSEIVDLDGENPHMVIPADRCKNGQPLVMALSTLAVEIIKQAVSEPDQRFVFPSPVYKDQPLHRQIMNVALRGNGRGSVGILEMMGIDAANAFKPHDFRHTAATVLVDIGYLDSDISVALGHTMKGDKERAAPRITGRYIHSHKLIQKRKIMEAWADELRNIINAQQVRIAA